MMIVQLELLVLSNASQFPLVKKNIMELHREPEFHGLNFGFLLSWFAHPKISVFFHFFANILANLSAYKETREVMVDPRHRFLENTMLSIFSIEMNRRKGTLKALKNYVFEWENQKFLEYLITPKLEVLDNFLKCLAFNLLNLTISNGIEDKNLVDTCKKLGIIFDLKYFY